MIQFDKHIFQMGGSTTNIAIIRFEMFPVQSMQYCKLRPIYMNGWLVWDQFVGKYILHEN